MLTPTEIEKGNAFWKWFEKNRFGFEFLSDVDSSERNKIFKQCSTEMDKFCKGLSPIFRPDISGRGKFSIVVSANGDPQYFQKAKELAALAPELPNWAVEGLIPPIPKKIQIRFTVSGIVLDPEQIGVALADIKDYPNYLAVVVGLKEFDAEQPELMQDVRSTITKLISNICGEEMVAYHIQYLEIRSLTDNPPEDGYSKLYDLPKLIEEYREECPSPVLENQKKEIR